MSETGVSNYYASFDNETIIVTNNEELSQALAKLEAGSGGTILLDGTSGPYQLDARDIDGTPDDAILIRSLDSDTRAVLEDAFILNCDYLTLNDLEIHSGDYGDVRPDWRFDLDIHDSSHIEISNVKLYGDADPNVVVTSNVDAAEDGIRLVRVSDVLFTNNEISHYLHGITLHGAQNVTIEDSVFHSMQGDGIRGGGVDNLTISNNYMHDFIGTSYDYLHSDFIQLWTGYPYGEGNSNVEISGNFLDSGEGTAAQGIFINNEAFYDAGDSLSGVYSQNISIHDNVVVSGMVHGISVNGWTGVSIENNTVLWDESSTFLMSDGGEEITQMPRIKLHNVLNTVVDGNITSTVETDGSKFSGNNVLLDYTDADAPNYAYNLFLGYNKLGIESREALMLRLDSPYDGVSGSSQTFWQASDAPVDAVMVSSDVAGDTMALELSAEYSTLAGALADPTTAQFFWTLEDGTVLEGMNVVHVFEISGVQTVTLDIHAADGSHDQVTSAVNVGTHDLFRTDFNGTIQDQGDWGTSVIAKAATTANGSLDLNTNGHLLIRPEPGQFEELDTLKVSFDFKPEAFPNDNWLMRIDNTIDLRITDEQGAWLILTTDTGTYWLDTDPGILTTGQFHEISFEFDGPAGTLKLLVDGEVQSETEVSGQVSANGRAIYIGDTAGRSAVGQIDNLEINTPQSATFTVETSVFDGTVPEPVTPPAEETPSPVEETPVEEEPVAEEQPPVDEQPPVEEPSAPEEPAPEEPVAEEPAPELPPAEPVDEPPEDPVVVDQTEDAISATIRERTFWTDLVVDETLAVEEETADVTSETATDRWTLRMLRRNPEETAEDTTDAPDTGETMDVVSGGGRRGILSRLALRQSREAEAEAETSHTSSAEADATQSTGDVLWLFSRRTPVEPDDTNDPDGDAEDNTVAEVI